MLSEALFPPPPKTYIISLSATATKAHKISAEAPLLLPAPTEASARNFWLIFFTQYRPGPFVPRIFRKNPRPGKKRKNPLFTRPRSCLRKGAFHIIWAFARPPPQKPCGQQNGAPGGIRTHDLWLRRPTLYPAELQAPIPNLRQGVGYSPGLVLSSCPSGGGTCRAPSPDGGDNASLSLPSGPSSPHKKGQGQEGNF